MFWCCAKSWEEEENSTVGEECSVRTGMGNPFKQLGVTRAIKYLCFPRSRHVGAWEVPPTEGINFDTSPRTDMPLETDRRDVIMSFTRGCSASVPILFDNGNCWQINFAPRGTLSASYLSTPATERPVRERPLTSRG